MWSASARFSLTRIHIRSFLETVPVVHTPLEMASVTLALCTCYNQNDTVHETSGFWSTTHGTRQAVL